MKRLSGRDRNTGKAFSRGGLLPSSLTPHPSPPQAPLTPHSSPLTAEGVRHPSPRQQGFTLTELVAVLLILGVLAALLLPRFLEPSTFSSLGYVQASLSAVNYAQRLAMASGCDIRVQFDPGGYRLDRFNTTDCRAAAGASLVPVPRPGSGDPFSEAPPDGTSVGSVLFYYDPIGRPRSAGGGFGALLTAPVTIAIAGKTLRVEAETGYGHVE